jgi:hypothetical protein
MVKCDWSGPEENLTTLCKLDRSNVPRKIVFNNETVLLTERVSKFTLMESAPDPLSNAKTR